MNNPRDIRKKEKKEKAREREREREIKVDARGRSVYKYPAQKPLLRRLQITIYVKPM